MYREEFHRYIYESKGNESNICQICAIKNREIVYEDSWRGFKLDDPVKQSGIGNKGAYMRKMAIDGYCLNLQFEEIRKLLHLLGKCGNNLNQYAKRANGYGDVYRQEVKNLQKEFSEMQGEMKQILNKLTEIS